MRVNSEPALFDFDNAFKDEFTGYVHKREQVCIFCSALCGSYRALVSPGWQITGL